MKQARDNQAPSERPQHGGVSGDVPGGSAEVAPARQGAGAPSRKFRIIFWVALAVLAVCLAVLAFIGYGYWQGQNTYNSVAQEAGFTPDASSGAADTPASFDWKNPGINWDALHTTNAETIAWVYIPGTNINYPVVHTSDNTHYLKTDFYGETNWIVSVGAIFLAAENAADFSDANNIIYGHNMNDGSMFSEISSFADQAFFDSNRTVYIFTPEGSYQLKTFALVHCPGTESIAQYQFADDAEKTAYVDDKLARSQVQVADIPQSNEMGTTFMLSTCDNYASDGRWVLFAYIDETTVAGVKSASDITANAEEETAE